MLHVVLWVPDSFPFLRRIHKCPRGRTTGLVWAIVVIHSRTSSLTGTSRLPNVLVRGFQSQKGSNNVLIENHLRKSRQKQKRCPLFYVEVGVGQASLALSNTSRNWDEGWVGASRKDHHNADIWIVIFTFLPCLLETMVNKCQLWPYISIMRCLRDPVIFQ